MKPFTFLLARSSLLPSAHPFSKPTALKKYASHRLQSIGTILAAAQDDGNDQELKEGLEVSRRRVISGLSALFLGKALAPNPASAADDAARFSSMQNVQNGARYSSLRPRSGDTNKRLAATAAVAVASSSEVYQYRPRTAPAESVAYGATVADPLIQTVPPRVQIRNFLRNTKWAMQAFLRVTQIVVLMMPAAIMYPFVIATKRMKKQKGERLFMKWLDFCLRQAERGGAVMIKLCQWASSRPDVFGTSFCDKFKRLQDSTTPHSWAHTERVMRGAFGENWADHFEIKQNDILGSGCIAQVYNGTLTDDARVKMQVAVKVVHPNVKKAIENDLRLLKSLARALENLPFGYGETLRWNSLSGMVEEFAGMLEPQLDLRNEAANLERFNKNFKDNPNVIFPQLISGYEAHNDVLVETFCSGVPVVQFCREHVNDTELRANLCDLGAHTMCTMIFEHNYVHGDLHPGNIFISPDNKLVLLDCGIVNEYDDSLHDLVVNIVAAFIRMDGKRAAELMVDDSNRRLLDSGESARDVEAYISEIENISKTARTGDFFFEKVTTYVNYIFNSASKHHVKMNPGFVSMALAVKVQEGVALMLNPKGDIIHIANPIILREETKRLKMGNFNRIRKLIQDSLRDFSVRQDRERNARIVSKQLA